jgi:hypothetical protein
MARPLALDLLLCAVPLGLALIAFTGGRLIHRLPRLARWPAILLAVLVVLVSVPTLLQWLPGEVTLWYSIAGGPTNVLGCMAVFLLGVVWSVPGRSMSSTFLVLLIALTCSVLLLESCGRLYWRFAMPELWNQLADKNGTRRQTTAFTCSPAAAVMLLHRYGYSASEGEMAYLSNTSLFGTDAGAMASAVSSKIASEGWRAEAACLTWEEARQRGQPFLAHVFAPGIGGHAVLVEHLEDNYAMIIDPGDGRRRPMPRTQFENIWKGIGVWVVK